MFTDTPTLMFPGYEYKAAGATVTADSIVIPLTALAGLDAAEAHATTGDSRKIAFELIDAIYAYINGLATADKPTKLNITRTSSVDDATGNVTRNHYVQTVLASTGLDVATE